MSLPRARSVWAGDHKTDDWLNAIDSSGYSAALVTVACDSQPIIPFR
jgi:hypothetical protein